MEDPRLVSRGFLYRPEQVSILATGLANCGLAIDRTSIKIIYFLSSAFTILENSPNTGATEK